MFAFDENTHSLINERQSDDNLIGTILRKMINTKIKMNFSSMLLYETFLGEQAILSKYSNRETIFEQLEGFRNTEDIIFDTACQKFLSLTIPIVEKTLNKAVEYISKLEEAAVKEMERITKGNIKKKKKGMRIQSTMMTLTKNPINLKNQMQFLKHIFGI